MVNIGPYGKIYFSIVIMFIVQDRVLILIRNLKLTPHDFNLVNISISHFWDRPVPIFSDVRFSYLALVQDKKNHVRFTGECMLSPRFLCRPTTLYIIARAVERQSAIYTENSGFASPTLGQHISTFRGYRIFIFYHKPYINRFTNHFSIHS